jgi:hypothetical protein
MKRAHVLVCLGVLTGCAGLIGVPDLTYDEQAGQGVPGPGTDSSTPGTDGNTPGTDGNRPTNCDETKLDTDPKNCGRCGHDCLGGACTAGRCESVVLKAGLENPDDIAVDATGVYVSTHGNAGTVLRFAKDGSKVDVLASGHTKARGVTLDGQNHVYWSNLDYPGDGGDGSWGGVWGCTLPACGDIHLVTLGDWAAHVRYANGSLFFAENNNSAAIRVQPDGTARSEFSTSAGIWSVAADATHVYFQANGADGKFKRIPLAAGATEEVGPLEYGGSLGFTAIDDERVYWAYSEYDTPTGHVYSALKSNLGAPKEQYGTDNKGSVGVAVDATTLYWTNGGTFEQDGTNKKDAEVLACPKAGCGGVAPIRLGSGLTSPGAIAVDADAVYFLTYGTKNGIADGELRRVAKP